MMPEDVRAMEVHSKIDRTTILILASLASFLGALMASSIVIAIPTIGKEFAVDAITLSWIPATYLLVSAMVLIPVGRMADLYGRNRCFIYGVASYALACLLGGVAPNVTALLLTRALQGACGAMIFGTTTAIVTAVHPPRERGRALGILVASVYTGLSTGPVVGGIVTQQLSWRFMFFLNAILGAAIVIVAARKMAIERRGQEGGKIDIFGSAIFAVALMVLMYGLSRLPEALGIWLILLGLVGVAAFLLWENHVPDPALDLDLFLRNPAFAMPNLAAFATYSGNFAVPFFMSLYLQYVNGLDPQTAGLILLAQPIIMMLLSPLAGLLSDRVEARFVAAAGIALCTLQLGLLALLNESSGLAYIIIALLVGGLGFALFSSPNSNAVMSAVKREALGVASSTIALMRVIGQMLSMGIATSLIAIFVGGVEITPERHDAFSNALRLGFILFTILSLTGVVASLVRRKPCGPPARPEISIKA